MQTGTWTINSQERFLLQQFKYTDTFQQQQFYLFYFKSSYSTEYSLPFSVMKQTQFTLIYTQKNYEEENI